MKKLIEEIKKLSSEEYSRAAEKFGKQHNSPHEAYAVIKEEFEEVQENAFKVEQLLDEFWEQTKANNITLCKSAVAALGREAILAACECVQVAAMAYKATLGYSGGTNGEH